MGELSKLPNIGKALEEQLNSAGIFTQKGLVSAGAMQAWLKIQQIDETACINRLQALEGAVLGVNKKLLPDEIKAQLKDFYDKNKK